MEIEEWNEYGELKEHVTIYHEGGAPSKPDVPNLLKSTPSKAPGLQENKKHEPAAAESSKDAETSKPPAGAQPTSFTLAMRQAGQEAAQKAKDAKKKVTETFTGVGEAEPEKEDVDKDKSAAVPPSLSLTQPLSDKGSIVAPKILQSPTSTTWKLGPELSTAKTTFSGGIGTVQTASLQSPTSTAWKSTDTNAPITMHRGSSISVASKEDIQKIEEECAIPEEDEDEDESEEAVKD